MFCKQVKTVSGYSKDHTCEISINTNIRKKYPRGTSHSRRGWGWGFSSFRDSDWRSGIFRVFLIQERSVENVWYFSLGLVLAQFWIPVWMIPIRLQAVKS